MTIYSFCTPEWFDANAKNYKEKKELQKPLKIFSKKMAYRIKADSSWGLEEDLFFCTFFVSGELTNFSLMTEDEAFKESDFVLSAIPQTWKNLLTGKSKFPSEFVRMKIKLEKGGKLQMMSIAPFSGPVVEMLSQIACKFPDEMSAQELEEYRSTMIKLQDELKSKTV